jgi:hypothetical protein
MPGAYTLESGIFSENNQLGSNCDTRTVSFFIIDDCAKVDLGENRVQCDNDSTFIQAIVTTTHGPFNLSWSTGGTESSISVSPMEDDIYTVTISDNTNCTSEFSIGVEVTDAKIIDFYIWDNAADTVFRKINDNDIVVVSEIPGNWNMLTDYEGLVDRVDYELRGDLYYNYTEYNVPYHFVGDNSNVGFIGLGSYILTAYPKETHSVESIGCAPFEKSFQIVDSAGCNMVTTTLDSLPGSLNYALQCVESGGTIFFSSSIHRDTIKLVNHMPTIDKEVTISAISEQPVFIQGLGTSSVFNISPSGQVTIRGLHILPGTANTGASIINNGILDLKDVTLHKHPSQTQSEQIQNNGTLTVQGVLQIKNE